MHKYYFVIVISEIIMINIQLNIIIFVKYTHLHTVQREKSYDSHSDTPPEL